MAEQNGGASAGAPPILIHPLTLARWDDLLTLFGGNGACGGCWDMFYRQPARVYGAATGAERQAAFRALAGADRAPGLLAYRAGTVAGWCALGPRADFPRLAQSKVFAPVDATPAWVLVCFFTHRRQRGQGVAAALLRGALAFAEAHGAPAVEACAVEPVTSPLPATFAFPGPAGLFRAAGFREVARRSPTRPLMRYDFGSTVR